MRLVACRAVETYLVRMWLPDRPGALGQVASRVGAVRGEIVGIDILERGGGRAIDELVIQLPDPALVDLLVQEVQEVEGVDVEEVRPVVGALHDPRLDALESAATLVDTRDSAGLLRVAVEHACRAVGAEWSALVAVDVLDERPAGSAVVASQGPAPSAGWLAAFVHGSDSSRVLGAGDSESRPADVVWAPLLAAGLALVVGRGGSAYRARERRQVAVFARIVDARLRQVGDCETAGGSAGCADGVDGADLPPAGALDGQPPRGVSR